MIPTHLPALLSFFSAALLDSVTATSHWSAAKLLDWSGPSEHWRLTGISAACEYRTPKGVKYLPVPDNEVLALSRALDMLSCQLATSPSAGSVDFASALAAAIAAQPQLATPTHHGSRTGNFALAFADADTEYSGVYSTTPLLGLISSTVHPWGIGLSIDECPAQLALKWRRRPISDTSLLAGTWNS